MYPPCVVCGPAYTSFLTDRTITHTVVVNNVVANEDSLKVSNPSAWQRLQTYRTYDQILVQDQGYKEEYYGRYHPTLFIA